MPRHAKRYTYMFEEARSAFVASGRKWSVTLRDLPLAKLPRD